MGLDIYFEKVKPSKGVNVNSVEELSADRNAQHKKKFNKVVNQYVKRIKQAIADDNFEERNKAIAELREYIKETMVYDWYWKAVSEEKSNKEILDEVKSLKKMFYPHEDVYFRKANFVYRFFHPYLVDEACIVTKDMVNDLLERCNKIIKAAKEEGLIDENGEVDSKYYYSQNFMDLSDEERKAEGLRVELALQEMPSEWTRTAESLLPTQSGFFFGGTEYTPYYLSDILSCKDQFEKLLADWKDNEVVYNIMSW